LVIVIWIGKSKTGNMKKPFSNTLSLKSYENN